MTELKGETDNNMIVVDLNTSLSIMDKSFRQKISKNLNTTTDKMDLKTYIEHSTQQQTTTTTHSSQVHAILQDRLCVRSQNMS